MAFRGSGGGGPPSLEWESLRNSASKTWPVVITGLNTDAGRSTRDLSAAAVMVMLPNIAMTVVRQRYLVRGLTLGAVKG